MASTRALPFQITAWKGSQHPTSSTVTKLLKAEKIIPYEWEQTPNHRFSVRSHNTHKLIYVIDGTLEISFPDQNMVMTLRVGDRVDILPNTRYGVTVGKSGVKCIEASIKR